jgi:hypothetical protein
MTTRRAACNCGQLRLTIEGDPARISLCHCLECQRRTGAVISNQARFRREQLTFAGQATAWTRTAESGNALTFISVRYVGLRSTGRMKAFLDMSPLPSATSRIRIFLRQPSPYGRSHATPGSPCRLIRRPSARRSRGDKTTGRATGEPVSASAFVGRIVSELLHWSQKRPSIECR